MKKFLSTLRIGMALIVATFSSNLLPTTVAYATQPTNPGGNESCPVGTTELAKYNFTSGGYVAESGSGDVTVTGGSTSGTFTVVKPNTTVSAVVVKGGTDAKTMTYANVTTGTFNNTGLLNNGGQTPAISNVKICGVTTTPQPIAVTANVTFDDKCGTANDTFTLEQKTGVTYTVNNVANDIGTAQQATGTVSVKATASNSAYTLTGTDTFSKVFTNEACPVVPTPVTAGVTFDDQCGIANDTFTLDQKAGVKYMVNGTLNTITGPQAATGTVSVVASATNNTYVLNGSYQFSKDFTDVKCPRTITPCVQVTSAPVITSKSEFATYSNEEKTSARHEFVNDGLRIYTLDATSEAKIAWYKSVNFSLQNAGTPSMVLETNSGSIAPGMQMVVDFDNNGTPDGILVGEAIYGNDWWLSNNSAQFVKDGAPSHTGGSGSANHGTLDQWLTNFPNAQVKAVGFSLGSGVKGDYTIRSLTFGCVKYTFDKPAVKVTPANPDVNDVCGKRNDLVTSPKNSTGVSYTAATKSGNTWTFTATPSEGYVLDLTGTEGYVMNRDGSATWTKTLTDVPCDKVTICHRTNSVKNPYVKITVSINAVDGIAGDSGNQADHYGEHQGPLAYSEAYAQYLKDNKQKWGDIIPPVAGHQGQNWSEQGQAMLDNDCNYVVLPPSVEVNPGQICIEFGETGSFTVEVTNPNSFAMTYKLKVGTDKQTVTVDANSTESVTFTGYDPGTYEVDVYQKAAKYEAPVDYLRTLTTETPRDNSKWEYVDSFEVTLEQCPPEEVVATPPTIVDPTCEVATGRLIIPTKEGVDYTINGQVVAAGSYTYPAGSSVTVEAEAQDGYTLGESTSTFTFTFAAQPTNCTLGETDVCPNLTGSQPTVPAGYVKINNECGVIGGIGGGSGVLGTSLPASLPSTGGNSTIALLNIVLAALAAYAATYVWQGRKLRSVEAR